MTTTVFEQESEQGRLKGSNKEARKSSQGAEAKWEELLRHVHIAGVEAYYCVREGFSSGKEEEGLWFTLEETKRRWGKRINHSEWRWKEDACGGMESGGEQKVHAQIRTPTPFPCEFPISQ